MWLIADEKQQEASRKAMDEQFMRWVKEAGERREAVEAHKKAGTCPHCGQCPPLPPWLLY